MDDRALRAAFRGFAGDERYRNFIRAVNLTCRRKGRLLFWQEQLWKEFVASRPDLPPGDSSLIAVFSVCDVHHCPVQPASANDKPTDMRDTPESDAARHSLFPFAARGDLMCPACQAAREKWIAENAEICRVLRCRTTYEDHCRRHLGDLLDRPDLRAKMKERAAEIARQMEPGDELWEWDAGGWHQLAGAAGVAIVRKGKIVKKWCESRS